MVNRAFIWAVIFAISGCSSVKILNGSQVADGNYCNVTVYLTLKEAEKNGEVEELRIVTGTSSGSFSHTVASAVEKHKSKVCQCGASNAYIQSRAEGDLGIANVTMIGFRYGSNAKASTITSEVLRRAELCQSKGGVYVNDGCQIPLD